MSDEIEKPMADGADYGADKIRVLEGLEAVRVRPAMYIGDTGQRGLHHLVYEVVDNSIDEALAGYAHNIKVTIHRDDSVTVEDDGRGIPVDMHPTEHKPAVEVVLTVLHAGGKFDHNSYKVSGGLHGVGVSCVNALSDWMNVQVFRDGKTYEIGFRRGVTSSPLKLIGETDRRGTTVSFKPDATIFQETTVYEWEILSKRLRELAFLNRGIHIDFVDERIGKEQSIHYHYENGICEFVSDVLNKDKTVINEKVIYFNSESDGIAVEVAMQYNDTSDELIYSYANNIHTVEGGTHLSGFQGALTRTINAYVKKLDQENENQRNLTGKGKAKAKGKDEKEVSLGPTDVREGLSAVISVKVPEPQFEGQTKTKLGNSAVKGIVERIINSQLAAYLEEHPDVAKRIVDLAKLAQQAREAASRARVEVRKQSGVFGNKGKLQDCSSNDPALCELFIVEGNSAAGTAKEGRDSEFQAILPIRGKPLNVEKVMIDRVLANKEIQSLAYAIGAGFNENDEKQEFDVSKARYHRVVIMTDADVDGSHIRTLLLTFFYRHMKPLIEAGYVYIACPPLYKVSKKGSKKKDEGDYLQSDEELNKYLVDRGLEKLRVRRMDGTELDQEQVRNLILMRNRADDIATRLRRDGIVPEEYFSAVRDDGACPLAHLTVHETDGTSTSCYIYSGPEQDAMIAAAEERISASMPGLTGNETVEELRIRHDDIARHLDLVHIYVSDQMEALVADLHAYGLKPANIFGVGAPLYQAAVGTGEFSDVFSLENLFMMIRNSGKSESGLEVQRYKGLGEMNAAQLRETTMAPEHRKMIQVKLEDAAEAERMFVLLMGDEVERRRDYIEKYAANVKDLDI